MTDQLSQDRLEGRFERHLLRCLGMSYLFGGRGYGGVDCSSLILKAIRATLRLRVSILPWMTADQIARGHLRVTQPLDGKTNRCRLAFFDWDNDGIYEHAAARTRDGRWVWASSTAGKVISVLPGTEMTYRTQWLEINGAFNRSITTLRLVNWPYLALLKHTVAKQTQA
jgi:cell wall-associated NlpC family hydrolase